MGATEWRRERGRAHDASGAVVAGEVGAPKIRADLLPGDWAISCARSAFNLQRWNVLIASEARFV